MAFLMGARIIIWLLFVSAIQAIEVNVSSEWKSELGLDVTCAWETLSNDTLQSVRLYNNGQQFMIYRPETHGPSRSEMFRTPDKVMTINCEIITDRGRKGRCTLILEPYQPTNLDFTYTCEVSGERPMFRIGKKDFVVRALVPPSDAVMSATVQETSPARVMLNCSTSGLPAPNLNWKVGDNKVQADFTERKWNVTSKLWHVWSYFSYTRSVDAKVVCTPEVNSVMGRAAEYNTAIRLFSTSLSPIALAVFILLR